MKIELEINLKRKKVIPHRLFQFKRKEEKKPFYRI